jgi:hypothetical protein
LHTIADALGTSAAALLDQPESQHAEIVNLIGGVPEAALPFVEAQLRGLIAYMPKVKPGKGR